MYTAHTPWANDKAESVCERPLQIPSVFVQQMTRSSSNDCILKAWNICGEIRIYFWNMKFFWVNGTRFSFGNWLMWVLSNPGRQDPGAPSRSLSPSWSPSLCFFLFFFPLLSKPPPTELMSTVVLHSCYCGDRSQLHHDNCLQSLCSPLASGKQWLDPRSRALSCSALATQYML